MKKILGFATLSLALILASCGEEEKQKAVLELVSAETVSVSAVGGEQTIQVNSNSALTAKSSASWVTVAVKDNNTVTATVAAYDGADTRSATVTISNESELTPLNVRINQAAVQFDFNPKDYEFEAEGGSYSFPYTAETTLTAVADEGGEDWLTVNVTASEVVLTATANETVSPRESVVEWTIGSAKGEFVVSQKASEPVLEAEFKNVVASVGGETVVFEYATNSELVVNSDEEWIETYTEDGKLYIVVAANNGAERTGYVTWNVKGSSTLNGEITVKQGGSFLDIKLVPTVYTSDPASTLLNSLSLRATGTNVTAIKFAGLYTTPELAEWDIEELKAAVKDRGSEFTASWLSSVNSNGLNLSVKRDCTPGTTYHAVVWATNGTDEVYYVLSGTTFTESINAEFGEETQFYLIQNKADIYGEYYFLAKETQSIALPIDWGKRVFEGTVTFSDGDMSQDSDGFTYDWINVEGMWGSQFNSKYKLTNDIYQFDLYDGFLYSQDSESLGDLVNVATGAVQVADFMTFSVFNGGLGLFSLYGTLAGGVVDEDGTIALIETGLYDDQVVNGYTLGGLRATLLYSDDSSQGGWYAALKDFMFVPSGSYSPAKVAAASKKVEAIKKEARSMRRNYVELRDTRIEKAFKKVLSESKMHEASAI